MVASKEIQEKINEILQLLGVPYVLVIRDGMSIITTSNVKLDTSAHLVAEALTIIEEKMESVRANKN